MVQLSCQNLLEKVVFRGVQLDPSCTNGSPKDVILRVNKRCKRVCKSTLHLKPTEGEGNDLICVKGELNPKPKLNMFHGLS